MNLKVSITGHKQIDQLLKAMPKELNHKVLSAAHADAAKPLVDMEKAMAPVGLTGNLVSSIGVTKESVKKATQIGLVKVGPRSKKGSHGHLIEFGTRLRRTKKGANRGFMLAKPFVQPSFQRTYGQVESRIAGSVAKVLNRTMKRYIK